MPSCTASRCTRASPRSGRTRCARRLRRARSPAARRSRPSPTTSGTCSSALPQDATVGLVGEWREQLVQSLGLDDDGRLRRGLGLLAELRKIKSPAEVEVLRKAAVARRRRRRRRDGRGRARRRPSSRSRRPRTRRCSGAGPSIRPFRSRVVAGRAVRPQAPAALGLHDPRRRHGLHRPRRALHGLLQRLQPGDRVRRAVAGAAALHGDAGGDRRGGVIAHRAGRRDRRHGRGGDRDGRARPATASTSTFAATASARTSPTSRLSLPATRSRSRPGWCSRSSRCS